MIHPSLCELSHRPWPLPEGHWLWRQSWLDLAFLHYRVDAARMRPRIPPALRLEEFDGTAWVSVVPFRMADVMRGTLPSIPPLRSFPELNLRTYVEHDGKPGVWFFSLDADCWPIVLGGRRIYALPYFKASMTHQPVANGIRFSSLRRSAAVAFTASYRPTGDLFQARPGTFEHWVAERYCLYSLGRGRLTRVDVHHRPWPLRPAAVDIERSDILDAAGLSPVDPRPRCHFSAGVEVISFAPVRLAGAGTNRV